MATVVDEFNAINSTFNAIGRDLVQTNFITHVESTGPMIASPSRSQIASGFNDAPVDLLSVHFTGRQKELTLVTHAFTRPRGHLPLRCVLFGDQGVGKSQLTYKWSKSTFAQGENKYVVWMSATTVEKLDQGFSKILHLIDHHHQFHSEQTVRLTAARRWLEEVDSGNWLLVLDNVFPEVLGFLREHLPRQNGRGSILFTTRTKDVAVALASAAGEQHEIVQVPMLSVKDGVELFIGHFRGGEVDIPSAKAEGIVKSVGCLPLAISHAAAYMNQTGSRIDEMLALYQGEKRINAISWQNGLSEYEHKSVIATFSNQLEDLEQNSPDASNLLKVLAYFDPESIPLDMLVNGATAILKSQRSSSSTSPTPVPHKSRSIVQRIKNKVLPLGESKRKDRVDKENMLSFVPSAADSLLAIMESPTELRTAITQLQTRCLTAYQDSSCSTLRIHDLIQLVVVEKMKKSETRQLWVECAVEIVCRAFQQIGDHGLPAYWPQCEVLIPHLQSFTVQQDISTKTKVQLLVANSSLGWYLRSRGRYTEAERLFVQVVAEEERLLGLEDERTLVAKHNLGVVRLEQGRYNDADALLMRVLQTRKKKLGPEHLDTLNTMYELAYVYYLQRRYEESKELLEKVLKERERLVGSENIDTLNAKNMLALVYDCQGSYSDAKTLYKQVLQSIEEQFGPNHIHSGWVINNLALVYSAQGQYSDSEEQFKQALQIWEKHLGSDHPLTLMTKNSLSRVYKSQGRFQDAEKLLVHVLARREEVLGLSHPDTRDTKDLLSSMYEKLGRFDDAAMVRRRTDPS